MVVSHFICFGLSFQRSFTQIENFGKSHVNEAADIQQRDKHGHLTQSYWSPILRAQCLCIIFLTCTWPTRTLSALYRDLNMAQQDMLLNPGWIPPTFVVHIWCISINLIARLNTTSKVQDGSGRLKEVETYHPSLESMVRPYRAVSTTEGREFVAETAEIGRS